MVLRLIADKAQRQKSREYDLFRQIGLRTAHPAVSQSHASSGLSAARQPAEDGAQVRVGRLAVGPFLNQSPASGTWSNRELNP